MPPRLDARRVSPRRRRLSSLELTEGNVLHRLGGMVVAALFPLALPLLQTVDARPCEAVSSTAPRISYHFRRAHSHYVLNGLNAWCSAVGPAIVDSNADDVNSGGLAVISWNIHGDAGDVRALVERIRDGSLLGAPASQFVLLLQEVVRRGDEVPPRPADGSGMARPLPRAKTRRPDLREAARELKLDFAYVPSMRNGADREDRGNAILSTVPLASVDAFELPFGRQRRVVIAATTRGAALGGGGVRYVSVHLDTGLRFAAGGPARWRDDQATALVESLGEDPVATVVGGDLNTWWGGDEPAVRTLRQAYPEAADREPFAATWRGPLGARNRLDYLFAGGLGQRIEVNQIRDRFGSDHTPLYAWLPTPPDESRP
jgi:endonuclease/exonuclease/phosphatase family metal-dependent hydrolase